MFVETNRMFDVARFLDGETVGEQQSRYNGSSRVVTRFYDSFNRTVSLIK